jgi:hypothetical protein
MMNDCNRIDEMTSSPYQNPIGAKHGSEEKKIYDECQPPTDCSEEMSRIAGGDINWCGQTLPQGPSFFPLSLSLWAGIGDE